MADVPYIWITSRAGCGTEVYLEGKKVEQVTEVTFHAEGGRPPTVRMRLLEEGMEISVDTIPKSLRIDADLIPELPEELKPFYIRNNAERRRFYYTFGSDERYPFQGGWVEIIASDIQEANRVFRQNYPDRMPDTLNCADYYTEQQFYETDMPRTGNRGAYCHRKIDAFSDADHVGDSLAGR